MCGINGIVGLERINDPQALVKTMNTALAHRGPDAEGIGQAGNAVLGHRRLAIIDLRPEGVQPMWSHDKKQLLVFNGEIYNYKALREKISEYPFRTETDSEVLLAAWQKWGERCVGQLEGMFAFAIWEPEKQELFIARDRLGIKPLYFYRSDTHFLFSSEIRSLLASGQIKKEIDQSALADYFRYQTVHAPRTLVKDVFELLPGHTLKLSDTEFTINKYWDPATFTRNDAADLPEEQVKKEIREKLRSAVEKRLVADVPFGAFLSGGIDSSAIVGLMAEVSSQPVNTFNVSFAEEEFSEAKYARIISTKFNTRHTEVHLTPNDFLEQLPEALAAMDHPSGDGPNTYVVSGATKNAGITMALSGLGGDELFAGYEVFHRLYDLDSKQWLQYFPMPLRKLGAWGLRTARPSVASEKISDFLHLEYFDLEHVYPLSRQIMRESEIAAVLNRNRLPKRSVQEICEREIGTGTAGAELYSLSRISICEMTTYMQNVLLRDTDQMSMAHALEVRVPFLDHDLVEYVLGVRNKFKFPHTPKKLLVESLGDLLPQEIVNRPKMGFTLPWKEWLNNELRSFAEERIHRLSQRSFINEKVLIGWWERFLKNDPRMTWSRVWHLVVLEDWLERNDIKE